MLGVTHKYFQTGVHGFVLQAAIARNSDMENLHTHRVEKYVLRPLSLSFLIPVATAALRHDWFALGAVVVAWWLLGMVGASLNREQTFRGLMDARPPPSPLRTGVDDRDAFVLAKVVLGTALIMGLFILVLLSHRGFRWYFAAVGGALAGLTIIVWCSAVVGLSGRSIRRQKGG